MTFGAATDSTAAGCWPPASSFVGRRSELREIRSLLADCRLITLTGPGGVGKSRLAHRATTTVRRAYENEIYCIDLAAAYDEDLLTQEVQDPDVLAHLIAGQLGPQADAAAGTATESLVAALAQRSALLLLDNCEQLLPACAVLAALLLRACPRLRIMATSREPLRVTGEAIFPVQPLPIPPPTDRVTLADLGLCESVALFVERAEAVSGFALTEQNSAAVAELCRRLDGLPLAIELAAGRTRALAPAQILQRTSQRFALLSRGNRTAPYRQRTLRACFDWSYELCSKPERVLWARLSVFPGAFELDAVEGICTDDSLPAADLLDQVAGLVEKSVVVSEGLDGDRRYRMLSTVRDYGEVKLIESDGRDEISRRHGDWYRRQVRATADWFGPGQADWFARLDRELPNLRATLTSGLADPDGADQTLEMAAALWPLWTVRRRHSEGRRWLDQALARPTDPTPSRIEALYGSAALAAAQGDLAVVSERVRQAHGVAGQLGDDRAYAIAVCADGVLASALGNVAAAVSSWRRAVDGFTAEPDKGWRAVALAGLARAAALTGDVDTASACHDEIVALCPTPGEFLLSGDSLVSLGLALRRGGQVKASAVPLREGLRRLQQVDGTLAIAGCLAVLAGIAGDERRGEQAATLFGAANRLRRAGTVRPPLSAYREESEQRALTGLSEAAYRAAHGRGEAMSVDDAIAYGLVERRQPQPPPPEQAATPLTRRERQVAELVAQGRSNRDIAAALVISRRTAESHIEKILVKLGFSRRAQIAAWIATVRSEQPQDRAA